VDGDEEEDGVHPRHRHNALLRVEAAVWMFGGLGKCGLGVCGGMKEGRDVTLVLLQGKTGSYSFGS
jgi:hypothetical protein